MNELQLTLEELKVDYMETKVQQMHPNTPDRDPSINGLNEEELFDKIIYLVPINNTRFIMVMLSARQRAAFWDRLRVVNAYEHDGMSEREYMVNYKKVLYNKYLNQ